MSTRAIWKFPLESRDNRIDMPVGARVLAVQVQQDRPCLWVLVNPVSPTERRQFVAIGTGQTLPEDIDRAPYVGTVQVGPFVWHVFEGRP